MQGKIVVAGIKFHGHHGLTRIEREIGVRYSVDVEMACDIAARVEKERGPSCAVVSVHTLKPLDRAGVADILRAFGRVVVIEEHAPFGGLGPQVKQIAWEIQAPCRLDAFSLKDEFIHVYGSHADLLKAHGLDSELIYRQLF